MLGMGVSNNFWEDKLEEKSVEDFEKELEEIGNEVQEIDSEVQEIQNETENTVELIEPYRRINPINGNIKKQHMKKSTPDKPGSRTDSLGLPGS